MEIDNKQHEDFASLSSVSYIRGGNDLEQPNFLIFFKK